MNTTPADPPVRILYVEDDRDLVDLVKDRLATAGFLVDEAHDGEEALRMYARGGYDLVALDQTLPGADGLGVLREIASRGPLPPIVMVTGTGNEAIAVETMKLGADDYIIKDLEGRWLSLLPSVIERVIRHHRLAEAKKAAEAALREKERQLWHAQKLESLGILAGGLAHDFNNILAAIMGYADLVRRRLPESDPARQDMDVIISAVERAADLTRQMLAYAGKGKFLVETLDLSQIVEDTRKLLEVSVSKKAALIYNLAADLPSLAADPSQVHQVIVNLVLNGSDALEQNSGTVAISTDTVCAKDVRSLPADCDPWDGLCVRLRVSDTGCGMDQETLARMFDPFFTTKFTGRGLGLAAVQGIVRSHHGTVDVASQPGKGTTVQVCFPASGPPVPHRGRTGNR